MIRSLFVCHRQMDEHLSRPEDFLFFPTFLRAYLNTTLSSQAAFVYRRSLRDKLTEAQGVSFPRPASQSNQQSTGMKVCFSFHRADLTQMFYLCKFISNSICCFNSSRSQNLVCSPLLSCGQVYVYGLGCGENVLCCAAAQVVKHCDRRRVLFAGLCCSLTAPCIYACKLCL